MLRRLSRIGFFLLIVKPVLAVMLGVNLFRRENLPRQGPFILIANHNSHLDTIALMNLFPLKELHRIHPAAAADYFMRNRLLAWFSTSFLNIIPIPRSGFTKSDNPLTRMSAVLEQGDSLIVFPEGSRGQPEQMSEFKSGIAHLIRKYPHIPVIPVFLRGLGRSLPKGEFLPVPFFCDIVIGAPCFPHGEKAEIVSSLEQTVHNLAKALSE